MAGAMLAAMEAAQRQREGDRSIDVYVHKLRLKLEHALPGRQFIHTHVGFGYRFAPARSGTPNNEYEESL